MHWFRWIAFLPAAFGSYVATAFLVGLLWSINSALIGDLMQYEIARQAVAELGAGAALTYVGGRVAPQHHLVVGLVILVISAPLIGVNCYHEPTGRAVFLSALGLFGSGMGCFLLYREGRVEDPPASA